MTPWRRLIRITPSSSSASMHCWRSSLIRSNQSPFFNQVHKRKKNDLYISIAEIRTHDLPHPSKYSFWRIFTPKTTVPWLKIIIFWKWNNTVNIRSRDTRLPEISNHWTFIISITKWSDQQRDQKHLNLGPISSIWYAWHRPAMSKTKNLWI